MMSPLREEIRAILREEIAAMRGDMVARQPQVETVRIGNSAELNRFARDLLSRAASDSDYAAAVTSGAQHFELAGGPAPHSPAIAAPQMGHKQSPARAKTTELAKRLVSERDIDALDTGAKVLRVPKNCRLTPLASDEARRRGIRIERFSK